MPVFAHSGSAVLRLEVLLITVIDKGIEPVDGFHDDVAAFAAVATVGTAEFNEFLASE